MEKLTWHVRISVVRMCGITVGNSHKIFNKAVSWHVVREASFGSRCIINYGMLTRNDSRFTLMVSQTLREGMRVSG